MRFTYYPSREEVEQYYGTDETMMMLVSFDGESAVIAPAIETVEHHTLLAQAGIRETEIDRYFRIVFDDTAAHWTFVCPRITGASPTSRSASPSFTRMASGASPRRWRKSAIWWSCTSQAVPPAF